MALQAVPCHSLEFSEDVVGTTLRLFGCIKTKVSTLVDHLKAELRRRLEHLKAKLRRRLDHLKAKMSRLQTKISKLIFHRKGAVSDQHSVMRIGEGFKEVTLRNAPEVKLAEIAKLLENVEILDLSLCLRGINMTMVRLSTVFQHLSLFPKLQELYLDFENCKFLPEDFTQNPVSTTFPLLKTLTLCEMDFSSVSMLSCAFGMIFGCTNLQNLRISAIYKNDVPPPAVFPPEVDFSTMGQLHLQNVELVSIKGLENEVCLIKYILACSPMLKSIEILPDLSIKANGNETYKLASMLLKLHRASPVAELIF